jgi:predicted glycosyltransferase
VIELFPFGRLKFAYELIPLLERAKAAGSPTKVVCSLRDILVSKRERQQFEDDACRIVNEYFDLLLVHSDPRFQSLDETFSRVSDLKCPIRYTGFVAQTIADCEPLRVVDGEKIIVVSIGGGRVGVELIDCAIEASSLIANQLRHRMLIFAGPYCPQSEFQRLQSKIAGNAAVELQRYTTRFISYLRTADLSISMAGYNTCLNIISVGVRAIVYPFTGNDNQEQTIRANKLQKMGIVDIIDRRELAPTSLAEKMMTRPEHEKGVPPLNLNGATNTAAALIDLVN